MASLATFAVVQPSSVALRGFVGSSISGMRLAVRPGSWSLRPRNVSKSRVTRASTLILRTSAAVRCVPIRCSFALQLFPRASSSKSGLLLKFLILGGGSTLAYFSATASSDILPIKKGPQLPPN
ncbi:hypothetical protein MLD38_030206 [Melastoma candidum]|uniref:Uncharacterized protein n=1 Tax=Melastoma candidum TaxID=119954 RepID=A0ACB9ML61_9MYRT|nr:hypothetical protein MLD38_030206 [Melastoma candidum]